MRSPNRLVGLGSSAKRKVMSRSLLRGLAICERGIRPVTLDQNSPSARAAEAAALSWLYSLADQERGVGWNPRASPDSQWKLGRTRALLDLAGAPDHRLKIALVAGTKGKGSTCATLASILGAAGVRGGLYTQPHLQAYRERIRVDGAAIAPCELAEAVARMRRVVPELPPDAGEPTTFEVTTAIALEVFARQACELAVVEVGLGGR